MYVNDQHDQRGARREYAAVPLRRANLAQNPLDQFAHWLQAALDSGAKDATAMALATVGAAGTPSVRIVLLKHFDERGYCWYSDYQSRKGADLAVNARASAAFYWRDFDRQVRISGRVEKLPAKTSEDYFASRPVESRFAAAASVQSAPISDRQVLEDAVAGLRALHPDGAPPRPDRWGGYRLCADEYEFWQGREGRLHDRFRFLRRDGGGWFVERLQP